MPTATPQSAVIDEPPTSVHFDSSHVNTVSGVLKIVQIITSLIAFICCRTVYQYRWYSSFGWFNFVTLTAFWISLLLLFFYSFHITDRTQGIPWLLLELIYCALWSLFYFIAAIVAIENATYAGSWGAAAFFACISTVVFSVDTYLKFKEFRSNGTSNRERTDISTSTSGATVTSSGYQTEISRGYPTQASPPYEEKLSPGYPTPIVSGYQTVSGPDYSKEVSPPYDTVPSPGYTTQPSTRYQTVSDPDFQRQTIHSDQTKVLSPYQ